MMQATLSPQSNARFAALDGWRGICALLVAALHFEAASHIYFFPIVANATLFVDFFFVLSGFVIAHAYRDKLQTTAQIASMFGRRLARLWPLHIVVLVAFVLLDLMTTGVAFWLGSPRRGSLFNAGDGFALSALPTHLVMLQGFGLHSIPTWNIPSWSVSAEFWTLVPFVIFCFLRDPRTVAWPLTLAAIGALVVFGWAPESMASTHDFGFFRCLFGFFIGQVVHSLHQKTQVSAQYASHLEFATVCMVISFVSTAGFTPFAFAAPIVFGLTVWVFSSSQGPISRVLHSHPLQLLGRWSYGIYMIHALVVLMISRALTLIANRTGTPLSIQTADRNGAAELLSFGHPFLMDIATLAYLAVVVGISAALWRFVEMPAQLHLNRFFTSRMFQNHRSLAMSPTETPFPLQGGRHVR